MAKKDNIKVLVKLEDGIVVDVQSTSHKVRAFFDDGHGNITEQAVGRIKSIPKEAGRL